MTQVLSAFCSIDGQTGLDTNGDLLTPRGVIVGTHGKQFTLPSPQHVVVTDDFIGPTLNSNIWSYVETDTDGTGANLAGGIGGVLRLTTGNDDGNAVVLPDLVGVTSALQWQASNGGLTFQTRIKISRITLAYIFVGFTDLVTVEAPVIASGTADGITTNASDAVGFMFDTGSTSDTWFLVGVAGNTDATKQVITSAPVADDYVTLRIEVTAAGAATFYINGSQVGSQMSGAVTAGTDLTPCVYASNTDGTSALTLDVDYIHVSMDRAADGDAT
jgi:hypothetical protein